MPLGLLGENMQNNFEPMVMDMSAEENENLEEEPVIVENSSLDLEAYCSNYSGLARLHRLIFIADRCTALRVEALKMALSYVQHTYNVALYTKLHRKLLEAMGEEAAGGNIVLPDIAGGQAAGASTLPQLDSKWVESRTKNSALKLEKLDADLKSSKVNSIKESIRRGHDDLGDHYLDCGDLSSALKCYSRSRDYCTSFKHVISMCFNVIKVSVYLNNWTHVINFVGKAETTPEGERGNAAAKKQNVMVTTRLSCAAGLAHLATKKYKMAAKSFLAAQLDACDFPDLVSASNVALYGGLCALATFSRQELQKQVISSSSFKLFLEVEPQLRDIIFKFYESKYASCLTQLDNMMNLLWLDIYLAPHMKVLYENIRNRALIQYFSPYMSADLEKMAVAFNTTVFSLEDELMKLILDGQIQARIDSHNKILYAKSVEERRVTFERALEMGKEHEMKMQSLILRSALIKNQIYVKQPQRDTSAQSNSEDASISGTLSDTLHNSANRT